MIPAQIDNRAISVAKRRVFALIESVRATKVGCTVVFPNVASLQTIVGSHIRKDMEQELQQ